MTAIEFKNKTILVTGAAGFIGSYLVRRLLCEFPTCAIVGLDSMNDYYDVGIKKHRLQQIEVLNGNWTFVQENIADKQALERMFEQYRPAIVVNLAAQAGVRSSITNPDATFQSNVIGFYNLLEACRRHPVEHLIYASSSSVYGTNHSVPYSTEDKVDTPVSLYAATKKGNELMAHAYSKLYNIPCTGLRFFTVYGPAGRPDMAYYSFAVKMQRGETIQLYNYGKCKRDFTYIDDLIEGLVHVIQSAPDKQVGEDGLPVSPYRIYNIGNSHPENLIDFVNILKDELIRASVLPQDYNLEEHLEFVPMQAGDVTETYADITPMQEDFGFHPSTALRKGLRSFAQWFADYHV